MYTKSNPSRSIVNNVDHRGGLMYLTLAVVIFLSTAVVNAVFSQSLVMNVNVKEPKAAIQPTMWGIFFEDINFAADGGIYAELVKNRSFEFSDPLMGWTLMKNNKYSLNNKSGSVLIVNRIGDELANPHFARIEVNGDSGFVMVNEGFRGMGIKKDNVYNFSIMASVPGDEQMTVNIALHDKAKTSIGEAKLTLAGKEWKKYDVSLTASSTDPKASLSLHFTGKGIVDADIISLFPKDTWKNRPNGFRSDLIQLLADIKPGFLRFPGGCIVEGYHLTERYQWKKTIGAPEDRELIINRWNTEFKHRPTPDYYQTFGVGFFEYFQLSEDIGAEPLPILSCGMACQFNSGEVVLMDQLDPYVQDALDLIEFANGDVSTKWGKMRSDLGHPESFDLKFLGVGNEQWGPQYIERYKAFADAIKSKYPDIAIISSAGPFPEGEMFDYATNELKELKADIVDEHYYANPDWFFKNAGRYDNYERSGPKIFAGEYAAQSVATVSPENKNTWLCALSEAAFMTGLERNADLVQMASYAPLFAHAEGWQWTPDLIWFDNLRAYGTPNYYVQKLFSINKGTELLTLTINGQAVKGQENFYASAVSDKTTREVIIKIVNGGDSVKESSLVLSGGGKYDTKVRRIQMMSADLNGVNTLEQPAGITPAEAFINMKGNKLPFSAPPHSFTVLRIKMR